MADPVSLSVISVGLGMASSGMGAMGQSAGAKASKLKAQKAAAIARVQADQADTAYRDELSTTLSNIDTIRASVGMDTMSPTALALKQQATEDSDRQRFRKVSGIRMQANQYDEDAAFYGSAAKNYLLSGLIGAAGKGLSGLSGMSFGSGGGSSGAGFASPGARA